MYKIFGNGTKSKFGIYDLDLSQKIKNMNKNERIYDSKLLKEKIDEFFDKEKDNFIYDQFGNLIYIGETTHVNKNEKAPLKNKEADPSGNH